jgi:hypothetical protein
MNNTGMLKFIVHRSSFIVLLALVVIGCAKSRPVVVGSKNFTESVILGELVAQKLESSQCKVDRRMNLGGSLVCDAAIASGSLDAYVEYSGTALTAILHQPLQQSRPAALTVPHDDRLALVGHRQTRDVRLRQSPDRRHDAIPQVERVLLDPARTRIRPAHRR